MKPKIVEALMKRWNTDEINFWYSLGDVRGMCVQRMKTNRLQIYSYTVCAYEWLIKSHICGLTYHWQPMTVQPSDIMNGVCDDIYVRNVQISEYMKIDRPFYSLKIVSSTLIIIMKINIHKKKLRKLGLDIFCATHCQICDSR